MRFSKVLVAAFLLISISFSLAQAKECRLMRYPDIHKDKIVFTYGGDLWMVSSQGGVARKLTSHPGEEVFPKFSPDGKYIGFTGEYEGGTHVYVMPSEGGEPRQLTFHPDIFDVPERMGYNDQMIEWYPDGKKILLRSRRESHRATGSKLFSVEVEGGLPQVDLAAETGGDLETHHGDGGNGHVDKDTDQPGGQKQGTGEEETQKKDQTGPLVGGTDKGLVLAVVYGMDTARKDRHDQTLSMIFQPKSPWGRNIKTINMIKKGKASDITPLVYSSM